MPMFKETLEMGPTIKAYFAPWPQMRDGRTSNADLMIMIPP